MPAISTFTDPSVLLAVFGLLLTAVLVIRNVRGAILIGIVATTLAKILWELLIYQLLTLMAITLDLLFRIWNHLLGCLWWYAVTL